MEEKEKTPLPEDAGQQTEPKQKTPERVSAFRNAREIAAREKRKEELKERARQHAADEAAYQAREDYAKELQEEKIDLIRLKQGVIEDSDKLFPKEEKKKKYTLRQKIGNWFYHSKWWLGIASFCVILVAFLAYDYFSRKDGDVTVMILTDNVEVYIGADELCNWLETMCDDYNEDGTVLVNNIYVPVSDATMKSGASASSTSNMQLATQLETATCMLVLADRNARSYLEPERIFMDMEKLYPDCPLAEGYKLKISGTEFEKQLGLSEPLPEDTYLAIRAPLERMSSQKEMQKSYDHAKLLLDQIVAALTEEEQGNEKAEG
ncbi:MAG: hypothetical protein IJ060_07565 [Oscillospiraceae bacterium]|nr:hypothetical protein [Oscillospiraceae bacterium]